jgi:SAM-dependent methyltransferase
MRLSDTVLANLEPDIHRLQEAGIQTHTRVEAPSPLHLDFLTSIAYFELQRRSSEIHRLPELAAFEQTYFGPEVGQVRRHFNGILESWIDFAKPLLDVGFGSTWWKETYWTRLPHVYGTEIVPQPLLEAKKQFPDTNRYTFAFTPSGLTEFPSASMDQVLSSSIIGYILPPQADAHLRECWRLLKPGGRLILTRVKARNFKNIREGNSKYIDGTFSGFETAYTPESLLRLVKAHCPGCVVLEQRALGFRPPLIPWQAMQKLYSLRAFRRNERWLNSLLPLFRIQLMLVVQKRQD